MTSEIWDTAIRVAMTHRILDDGLSPMEALAFVLREDLNCSIPKASDIMSDMTGKRVTTSAVRTYLNKARMKIGEETGGMVSSGRRPSADRHVTVRRTDMSVGL